MWFLRFAASLFILLFVGLSHAEEANPLAAFNWQVGPTNVQVGDKATISVPDGYVFLGAEDTRKFMEFTQNLPGDREYMLAPKDLSWFAIFEFNPIGYVKDDETVDADDVLETVKEGNARSNEEKRKRGWSTLSIVGWRFKPQYDHQVNLLEWALLAREDSNGEDIVNYNTRLLGRTGVMQVVLVANPAILDASVASLKSILTGGYEYMSGEKYAEFKQGDRVAEFGLAALIAGGATAVAAKKGWLAAIGAFFAAAWKFIVAIAIAAMVWLKKLFSKKGQ